MTTLDAIRDSLPDYARDLKLNLGTVLRSDGRARPEREADLGGGGGFGHRQPQRRLREADRGAGGEPRWTRRT